MPNEVQSALNKCDAEVLPSLLVGSDLTIQRENLILPLSSSSPFILFFFPLWICESEHYSTLQFYRICDPTTSSSQMLGTT